MGEPVKLVPPCTYQGGKQRLAREIIDFIDSAENLVGGDVLFYDMCCGSGAVTLELLGRGFPAEQVRMCDVGPWGTFWRSVGSGEFDADRFDAFLASVPDEKRAVRAYVTALAETDALEDTEYKFLLLQAASFGGKQVWRDGHRWRHSSFRNYWMPTAKSIRRSPVNPMQPQPDELRRRIRAIINVCGGGVLCVNGDVGTCRVESDSRAVVYIDPPYPGTTSYGYDFDILAQVQRFLDEGTSAVYVSLNRPLSDDAVRLHFGGPKGGISGNLASRWEEWLSMFRLT